ncbi:hypothetical protein V8F20_010671 [Naviculisporaceae sp. PSN 640]
MKTSLYAPPGFLYGEQKSGDSVDAERSLSLPVSRQKCPPALGQKRLFKAMRTSLYASGVHTCCLLREDMICSWSGDEGDAAWKLPLSVGEQDRPPFGQKRLFEAMRTSLYASGVQTRCLRPKNIVDMHQMDAFFRSERNIGCGLVMSEIERKRGKKSVDKFANLVLWSVAWWVQFEKHREGRCRRSSGLPFLFSFFDRLRPSLSLIAVPNLHVNLIPSERHRDTDITRKAFGVAFDFEIHPEAVYTGYCAHCLTIEAMAFAPRHPTSSQAVPRLVTLDAHHCCPWKCELYNRSAPPGAGPFSLSDPIVSSVFANGDMDRPATPVAPNSSGIAEPNRSAPTPYRPVTPIPPPPTQTHIAEPERSAPIHRPVTPEKPRPSQSQSILAALKMCPTTRSWPVALGKPILGPSQTLLSALKSCPATRSWPVTLGQPILGQPILGQPLVAALKASAATRSWPAALGQPILGQTLLAALKSSSVARHWPAALGQPIIAQPLQARPESSAPAVHLPVTSTATFPSPAAAFKDSSSSQLHIVNQPQPRASRLSARQKTEDLFRRLQRNWHPGMLITRVLSLDSKASVTLGVLEDPNHTIGSRSQGKYRLLTTHLASRAHLQAFYNAGRSAPTNPEIARNLHLYNVWYAQWDVEALLETRHAQKELKKAKEASARAQEANDKKRRAETANEPQA